MKYGNSFTKEQEIESIKELSEVERFCFNCQKCLHGDICIEFGHGFLNPNLAIKECKKTNPPYYYFKKKLD